jgi:hypothetical protein
MIVGLSKTIIEIVWVINYEGPQCCAAKISHCCPLHYTTQSDAQVSVRLAVQAACDSPCHASGNSCTLTLNCESQIYLGC